MVDMVAAHVAAEAAQLTDERLVEELQLVAATEAHECNGYGCMTCWAVAVVLTAADRLAVP